MSPPSVKQQLQTPTMFQRRTTETAQQPALLPCAEHNLDSEPQVSSADTQAALHAVQKLFKTELKAAVAEFSLQIRELGDRVDRLEYTADGHAAALQEDQKLIASHQAQMAQLENKVEDLENRSRRGNLRVREALGCPWNPNLPRDIVLKLHHVEVRDLALQAARAVNKDTLPQQMQLYAHLAPATLQKSRLLKPVTALLIQHKIKYR
ncbi:hypothetical protein XELAEV_18013522mg [Xenopus laevis]|uniref:Uncharacterized protein n=1 Tax=Xenopus laevis TaxID=8355 RepID=A0A974DS55_XENLA|nr:hypothetical protein XELAEV_18013522mg [Xenopus laevis]